MKANLGIRKSKFYKQHSLQSRPLKQAPSSPNKCNKKLQLTIFISQRHHLAGVEEILLTLTTIGQEVTLNSVTK